MNDDERAIKIERLLKERSEATARKTALLEEAHELAARIAEPMVRGACETLSESMAVSD